MCFGHDIASCAKSTRQPCLVDSDALPVRLNKPVIIQGLTGEKSSKAGDLERRIDAVVVPSQFARHKP